VGNRAVFLDRDGTINVEKGFVHREEDLEFVDGAAEALGCLNRAGYLVVVITNQSGVARGLYGEDDVHRLHRYMNAELGRRGAHVDRFYFCPHHPEAPDPAYRKDCECRKPNPGMVLRAMEELAIDRSPSYLIGDRLRDICAGKRAGVTSILIREREEQVDDTGCGERPDLVVTSLLKAVEFILKKNGAAAAFSDRD
jgi:D-glycero-D-manno-heptose 1,7-bisphosphate phosphatase